MCLGLGFAWGLAPSTSDGLANIDRRSGGLPRPNRTRDRVGTRSGISSPAINLRYSKKGSRRKDVIFRLSHSLVKVMPVQIFLSAVSDEFFYYRQQLNGDLTRQNVGVKTQEDFKSQGDVTIIKLDTYIASCDAVIHLVGDLTGSVAADVSTAAIAAKYPRIFDRLPPLFRALNHGANLSYTQWEAWLALYHKKPLMIAMADVRAPRGPNYTPSTSSISAQKAHLQSLQEAGYYAELTFSNCDNLAKAIAYTVILDLLAKDRHLNIAPLADALMDMATMAFVDVMRLTCVAGSRAARSANQSRYKEFIDISNQHFSEFDNHLARIKNNLDVDIVSCCREVMSGLTFANLLLKREPNLTEIWRNFIDVLISIVDRIDEFSRILSPFYYAEKSEISYSLNQEAMLGEGTSDNLNDPDFFVSKRFQIQSSLLEKMGMRGGIHSDKDKRLAIPYFTIDRTLLSTLANHDVPA